MSLLGVIAPAPSVRESTSSMTVGTPTIDPEGVSHYPVTSIYQGNEPQDIRVLEPAHPAAGQPRRILFVLPVNASYGANPSPWGDGLKELRLLDVQNRYNLTLIAPSFNYEPWYGDNPSDPSRRMESFILDDLVPFSNAFAQGRSPQRYLLGYSKSGNGALFLILRHPAIFNGAAIWDAPVQLSDIKATGISSPGALETNFGTQANFDRYNIPSLITSNAGPFRSHSRLWIGGDDAVFTADMEALNGQMAAESIAHTWKRGGSRVHRWDSGWLEGAVTGLLANAPLTASAAGKLPPPRTGGLPFGELPSGTAQTTLSLKTDQPATCRYASTVNTAYRDMKNEFANTGGTHHATALTGLQDRGKYSVYVRCRDTATGATNDDDYEISISVSKCRLPRPFDTFCR